MDYVYQILNKITQKVYIGSTKNYRKRKQQHLSHLRCGSHVNSHLQNSFNKYTESAFEFSILLECENYLEMEQKLIDAADWENIYNINKTVSGGDKISYHSEKEDIIRRIKLKMRQLHALEGEDNPWRNRDVKGEANPNWRGGIAVKYCSCGNKKANSAKTCSKCQDRSGENNPFYGKHHSEETKAKLSLTSKGRLPVNHIEVVIEGVEYESFTGAGRELNLSPSVVWHRCTVSTNAKFKDWTIKGVPKIVKEPKPSSIATAIICEGNLFESYTAASEHYGLSITAIINRVRSDNYPEFIKAPQAS